MKPYAQKCFITFQWKDGQDGEQELIALKRNIIIRVYDASCNCWIVNQEAHPKGERVISLL